VAAWAVCAPTDAEAEALASSFRMLVTLLQRGQVVPVPSVATAQRFLAREGGPAGSLPRGRRVVVGTPGAVREGLVAVAREYGAEEVLVVNILHDHAARRQCYELIAEAFGLGQGVRVG
jgi:alkanesulfonate monooxygenase SsuD/methylene tetrahydromethanopterin reductase-like flavin-dependent oxidoreductase (luciferase family)